MHEVSATDAVSGSVRKPPHLLTSRKRQPAFVDDLAAFHDEHDRLEVVDVGCRILAEQYQIGELASVNGTELVLLAEEDGTVVGSNADYIERRDPRRRQQ